MTKLCQRYIEDMKVRNYSSKTGVRQIYGRDCYRQAARL